MRTARVRFDRPCTFHCISRCIERAHHFDSPEWKNWLHNLMRRLEVFTGVTIITYVFMDNHFHLLLAENEPAELDDEAFLSRLYALYRGNDTYRQVEKSLREWRAVGMHHAAENLRGQYIRRMNDVSEFMKSFKQRATRRFNRLNGRKGPLWEERFKSVLVQGGEALSCIAAYIDLNPIRAGIVEDPKDYRWCGYAEAVAGVGGKGAARNGIVRLFADANNRAPLDATGKSAWKEAVRRYRKLLYVRGVRQVDRMGKTRKRGFTARQIEKVLAEGGRLPWHVFVRCRIRYFTEGVAIGSQAWIDDREHEIRAHLHLVRERMATPLVELGDEALCAFRAWRAGQVIPTKLE